MARSKKVVPVRDMIRLAVINWAYDHAGDVSLSWKENAAALVDAYVDQNIANLEVLFSENGLDLMTVASESFKSFAEGRLALTEHEGPLWFNG